MKVLFSSCLIHEKTHEGLMKTVFKLMREKETGKQDTNKTITSRYQHQSNGTKKLASASASRKINCC